LQLGGLNVRGFLGHRETRVDGGTRDRQAGMAIGEQMHGIVAAIDHAFVLRVQKVHVVELAEVVYHGLPVALVVYGLILHQHHVAKSIGGQVVDHGAKEIQQWLWLFCHGYEHETVPHIGVHLTQ
jgi:hypothetical protein